MFGNRMILFAILVTLVGLTACGEDSVQPATQIESFSSKTVGLSTR